MILREEREEDRGRDGVDREGTTHDRFTHKLIWPLIRTVPFSSIRYIATITLKSDDTYTSTCMSKFFFFFLQSNILIEERGSWFIDSADRYCFVPPLHSFGSDSVPRVLCDEPDSHAIQYLMHE